jgi:hypothetical protein
VRKWPASNGVATRGNHTIVCASAALTIVQRDRVDRRRPLWRARPRQNVASMALNLVSSLRMRGFTELLTSFRFVKSANPPDEIWQFVRRADLTINALAGDALIWQGQFA